jgi:N-acetylglutamate synthase-like GNAT family acetyltransferase
MNANAFLFNVQKAASEHSGKIQDLINQVDINPIGLDWRRFLVALTPDGELIGCGQIKPHADGTRELASIAVYPNWRGRGVATLIIQTLVAPGSEDLYLICESSMGGFYEKFGFHSIEQNEMPTYFRRMTKLPAMITSFGQVGESLLVMHRPRRE